MITRRQITHYALRITHYGLPLLLAAFTLLGFLYATTTPLFEASDELWHYPMVKRLADGAVEITSMNHGFAVERQGLPNNVRETHVSLFDDSNCGIELIDRPAFSVQYHPEASPGPQDSFYLFEKFVAQIKEA